MSASSPRIQSLAELVLDLEYAVLALEQGLIKLPGAHCTGRAQDFLAALRDVTVAAADVRTAFDELDMFARLPKLVRSYREGQRS